MDDRPLEGLFLLVRDATKHIKQCEKCLKFKPLPEETPMENIDATYPMESVHMDYLMIEANEGGKDVHILVITDHFTQICTSYSH